MVHLAPAPDARGRLGGEVADATFVRETPLSGLGLDHVGNNEGAQ